MSRQSFHKRDREKKLRERAAAKAAKREDRRNNPAAPPELDTPTDQTTVLTELAELHRRFDDEEISFDEFAEAKDELTTRLAVLLTQADS